MNKVFAIAFIVDVIVAIGSYATGHLHTTVAACGGITFVAVGYLLHNSQCEPY